MNPKLLAEHAELQLRLIKLSTRTDAVLGLAGLLNEYLQYTQALMKHSDRLLHEHKAADKDGGAIPTTAPMPAPTDSGTPSSAGRPWVPSHCSPAMERDSRDLLRSESEERVGAYTGTFHRGATSGHYSGPAPDGVVFPSTISGADGGIGVTCSITNITREGTRDFDS